MGVISVVLTVVLSECKSPPHFTEQLSDLPKTTKLDSNLDSLTNFIAHEPPHPPTKLRLHLRKCGQGLTTRG
jgi:hypothetical protein